MHSYFLTEEFYFFNTLKFFWLLIFILCVWAFCLMYVFVPHTFLVPTEARRGCQIPFNWMELQMVVSLSVHAEIEHGYPGRADSILLTAEPSFQPL